MNINLASKISEYRIDAYGEKEYQRIQNDQNTPLADVYGINSTVSNSLESVGIKLVSDLLDADESLLLSVKGIGEKTLEGIYDSVQKFIERIDEPLPDEEKLDRIVSNQELGENEDNENGSINNSNRKLDINSDSSEYISDEVNIIHEEE